MKQTKRGRRHSTLLSRRYCPSYALESLEPRRLLTAVSGIANPSTDFNNPTPGTITDLSAIGVSTGEIDLAWTNNTANASAIEVDISTDQINFTPITTTLPANATTFAATGLTENTRYDFQVKALYGPAATTPAAAGTYTAPATPTGLTAVPNTDGDGGVNLELSEADFGDLYGLGIEIDRRPSGSGAFSFLVDTPSYSSYFYTDQSAMPAMKYDYQVKAFNKTTPSLFSNIATATAPLVAPANFTATPSTHRINLSWSALTEPVNGITLSRSTDGINFSTIARLPASATLYGDTGLAELTHYYYEVAAINAPLTPGVAQLDTYTLPNAPSNLKASATTANGVNEVDLSWTDNSHAAAGFAITETDSINGTILIGTTSTTHFVDSYESPGTAITYSVVALTPYSDSSAATTTTITTPVQSASTFNATAVSESEVDLSWTLAVGSVSGVNIYESAGGNGFTLVNRTPLPPTQTTFAVTGLSSYTNYSFEMVAISKTPTWFSSIDAQTLPGPPLDLSASQASDGSVQLTWSDESPLSFDVYRKDPGESDFKFLGNAEYSFFEDRDALQSSRYQYYVVAVDSSGYSSPASAIVSVTTGGQPRIPLTPVYWIANASGDFDNPANWSDGKIPGVNDDVTIDNPAIVVTFNNESQVVNSLTTSATIELINSANLIVGSDVFGGGGIDLKDSAVVYIENGNIEFKGTQSLGGTGSVMLSAGAIAEASILGAADSILSTLTIGSGITIHGGGQILPYNQDPEVSILIDGEVIADVPGDSILLDGGQITSGNLTIDGTVAATAGEVELYGIWYSDTGILSVSGTGTLDLTGDFSSANLANLSGSGRSVNIVGQMYGDLALNAKTGSLILTAQGTIGGSTITTADGAQIICDGGTLSDVSFGPGSPLDFSTNSAAITVEGDLTLDGTSIDVGGGQIYFNGTWPNDTHTIGGNGKITLGAGGKVSMQNEDVNDSANFVISSGVTLAAFGGSLIINGASVTLTNEGTIACDTSGGTLSIITNGVTFTSPGTLEASDGGTVAIQGDYTFAGDATINIGIGSAGAGMLAISGAATLAGTLNVSLADGSVLRGNQTYDLLTYGSETGNFAAVNLPTTDGTETTTLGATAFTLTTPPATIAQLTAIVADDRSSLAQSKSQRRTTLHSLSVTRNRRQKSLDVARRSLTALVRENRRHPSDTLATEVAAQKSQVNSQSQSLAATVQMLKTDTRTDFTDVDPARRSLVADIRTLQKATQRAVHGG